MSEVTITAQPDGTYTDPTGKKFLPQDKVDSVVTERLARDREVRKDENATKAAEIEQKLTEAKSELQTANAKIDALQGTSATAEEISKKVKESHGKIVASIAEDKRKFIPKGYSEADQIVYISENQELFFPNAPKGPLAPITPAPENISGGSGGDAKYGGHVSLTEWAQRDPHGYMKAKSEGKLPK